METTIKGLKTMAIEPEVIQTLDPDVVSESKSI